MERTWGADKLGKALPNSPPWASPDAWWVCSFWKRLQPESLQPESLGDLESEHLTGRQRPLCAWAELGAQAHHMGSPECGGVGQIEPRRASFLSCPGGS